MAVIRGSSSPQFAVESENGAQLTASGMTLLAESVVTVDSTANGKTLAMLLGAAVNTQLKRLVLKPASTGVYRAYSANASASTSWVDLFEDEPITKADADLLKFYAASSTSMVVRQYG